MTSDVVKVARINRRADRDRQMLDFGRDCIKTGGHILVAALQSDAPSLLLSLGAVEIARRTNLVGDVKAGIVQGVLTAAFVIHGFQGGVSSG